jgi:hypothetical protein
MSEQSIDAGDVYPDLEAGVEVESDIDIDLSTFQVEDDGIKD